MATSKIGITLLGVLFVALLLALPAAAAAQSSTFLVPFDRSGLPDVDDAGVPVPGTGAFLNPCTSEFVDVFGATTISIAQSLDRKGNLKVTVSTVTKGTGQGWTGPDAFGNQLFTGNNYAFAETQQFMVQTPPISSTSEAFVSDFFDKIAMKGTRSIDNWIVRARFRIRVSADGTVLVNLVRLNDGDACKG